MSRSAPATWLIPSVVLVSLSCNQHEAGSRPARGAEQALYVSSEPPPCTLPASKAEAPSADTIVLRDTEYPCRLYFRETGVVLRGDSAGRSPYPGRHVARDSRGRFITSIAGEPGRLAIWNPDGSFNRTLGQPGHGPGEISVEGLGTIPFVDAADWIYVRGGGGRWTVFDAEYEFVGRQAVPSEGRRETNAVFPRGQILTSLAPHARRPSYFRVHEVSGALAGEFAPIPPQNRAGDFTRILLAADDSTFWAGPDAFTGGYAFERWSIDGRLETRIERDVAWFPETKGTKSPTASPVALDREGNLLVYSWVPSGSARDTTNPGADLDVHLEVIDWRGGRVLASEVVNGRAIVERTIPRHFFPRTHFGYLYDESEDEPVVRIIEYGVTSR